MKRWALLVVASAAVSLAVFLLFFRGSDEERARRTVERLAAAVKVVPDESLVFRAARVRGELVEIVAPEAVTTVPELGEPAKGRDALVALAVQGAQPWRSATISLAQVHVALEPPNGARVEATATLSAERHDGQSERDVRRIAVRLEKRDGAYRIVEITVWPRAQE